jgi:oligopeptide transport system substrate-binding protein
LALYYYRFNVTRKPLDDVRVRQALTLAIDKARIVQQVTHAGEQVAGSMTPPGIPGYTPPPGLSYDPEKARRLLAEAGFPGGRNFPVLSILYNSSEQNEQIATAIQAMWKETLGITVQLTTQEWKVYLNTLEALNYDISRSSWVGDYNDPNTFLDMMVTGRGNNRTGWSNADYDRLMAQSQTETEPSRRFATMQEAETILLDQGTPVAPIYYSAAIALYHPETLFGYEPNVIDEHPFRELSVRR